MSKKMRFGQKNHAEIESAVKETVPKNTKKTNTSIWKQFMDFCEAKGYQLLQSTPLSELVNILEDYAFNMKKLDGSDYKEHCIKTLWNVTAKMLQEKYFTEYNIVFNPFTDLQFQKARNARNAKRKILQKEIKNQKVSSKALDIKNIYKMVSLWDENCPDGLQRKIFHICSFELAWRGNEAAYSKIHFFKKELDSEGKFMERIEYNTIFSKTNQGGSKQLSTSKWLVKNNQKPEFCPVRLLLMLLSKRGKNITTDRLFITPNPNWQKGPWFKNSPLGVNNLSKWTKTSAEKIGLDTKNNKITNHSHRSSAVSTLAKQGIGEQQLIKITGHSHGQSIKPYLQLDAAHHSNMVEKMRPVEVENRIEGSSFIPFTNSLNTVHHEHQNQQAAVYQNCNFTINNYYK